MDIELRHLKIVLAVAEAGSVTRAAANLGLAQPALTTQLQRIERALGGALFERDRLGARPTALGDLVLARARVVLPALQGLQDEANVLVGSGGVARFRVGATNGPVAGGLVQRLTEAYPGRPVSMHSSWSVYEIAQKVVTGGLDLALVGACAGETMPRSGGLVWQPVSVDAVWVLLCREHPLARRGEVTLAELSGERWVSGPGDTCFNECFAAACAREGFSPRSTMQLDVGSVLDLVAGGTAVALAQGTIRENEGVTAVPITGVPIGWRHLLGWDRNRPVAAVAGEVFELAVAAYQDILKQRHRYAGWLAGHPELGVQSDPPR